MCPRLVPLVAVHGLGPLLARHPHVQILTAIVLHVLPRHPHPLPLSLLPQSPLDILFSQAHLLRTTLVHTCHTIPRKPLHRRTRPRPRNRRVQPLPLLSERTFHPRRLNLKSCQVQCHMSPHSTLTQTT
jgi:hypothetical protein